MQRTLIVLLIFLIFVTMLSCQSDDMPPWVKNSPEATEGNVYFVGKSEGSEKHETYLETKADALTDALMQFSVYKSAKINSLTKDQFAESSKTHEVEMATQMNLSNNSSGLYQLSEWMAKDGTLYVLYIYGSPQLIKSGGLSYWTDYWKFPLDVQIKNDRKYFIAMAVSAKNTEELAVMADQNAETQVLLWSGSDIKGNFEYFGQSTEEKGETKLQTTFEAVLKLTSRISLETLSFRKETQHIQKGKDQKYYYYGLYSINDTKPKNKAEYDYFQYYVKYTDETGPAQSFKKLVDFHGKSFLRNEPYPAVKNKGAVPAPWRKKLPDDTEDTIYFVGVGVGAGNSIVNKGIAILDAEEKLAGYISSEIRSMAEKEDADGFRQTFDITTRTISNVNTSGLKQKDIWVAVDGGYWVLFSCSKDALRN